MLRNPLYPAMGILPILHNCIVLDWMLHTVVLFLLDITSDAWWCPILRTNLPGFLCQTQFAILLDIVRFPFDHLITYWLSPDMCRNSSSLKYVTSGCHRLLLLLFLQLKQWEVYQYPVHLNLCFSLMDKHEHPLIELGTILTMFYKVSA